MEFNVLAVSTPLHSAALPSVVCIQRELSSKLRDVLKGVFHTVMVAIMKQELQLQRVAA